MLFLRNIVLDAKGHDGDLDARLLVFDKCWWADPSAGNLLVRFHQLETLVSYVFGKFIDDFVCLLASLPTTIRRVHVLEDSFYSEQELLDAPHALLHLESFTYTLLSAGESAPETRADDGPDRDALAEVQQLVESILDAPQCTFKFRRSTMSPEAALAESLAILRLDL